MNFLPYALMAVGSIASGNAKSEQYKAQAQADEYNSLVTRQRADSTAAAYGQREEQLRRESRIEAGQRAASVAQSGTGLGGSNADLERQSEILAELDALNIRYEGTTERKSLLDQSNLYSFQSDVNKRNAKTAKTSGWLNAGTSLLAGWAGSGSQAAAPIVDKGVSARA